MEGSNMMATPNNNNASEEEKIDPMKDIRAGLVREVGSQAIWSLSSCKPGKPPFKNDVCTVVLVLDQRAKL